VACVKHRLPCGTLLLGSKKQCGMVVAWEQRAPSERALEQIPEQTNRALGWLVEAKLYLITLDAVGTATLRRQHRVYIGTYEHCAAVLQCLDGDTNF